MINFVNFYCALSLKKINHPLHQLRGRSSWKIYTVFNLLEIPQFTKLLNLNLACLISFSPTYVKWMKQITGPRVFSVSNHGKTELMLNFICKLRKHLHWKELGQMNIELVDTDTTGCSITGNNHDPAHMADFFLPRERNVIALWRWGWAHVSMRCWTETFGSSDVRTTMQAVLTAKTIYIDNVVLVSHA